jgi:hypothetical protein
MSGLQETIADSIVLFKIVDPDPAAKGRSTPESNKSVIVWPWQMPLSKVNWFWRRSRVWPELSKSIN